MLGVSRGTVESAISTLIKHGESQRVTRGVRPQIEEIVLRELKENSRKFLSQSQLAKEAGVTKERARQVLNELQQKYPTLRIHRHKMSEEENRALDIEIRELMTEMQDIEKVASTLGLPRSRIERAIVQKRSLDPSLVAKVSTLRLEQRLGDTDIAEKLGIRVPQVTYIIERLAKRNPAHRLRQQRSTEAEVKALDAKVHPLYEQRLAPSVIKQLLPESDKRIDTSLQRARAKRRQEKINARG